MDDELAQIAINCALQCNWDQAIKTNLLILKENKEDVDALNRLSRAYFEMGEVSKAKKTSLEAIKINPINNIAVNALEKYKHYTPLKGSKKVTGKNGAKASTKNTSISQNSHNNDASTFIEEPGKTKITTLINLGSEKVYSLLSAGDIVKLTPHTHKVSVTTTSGAYIGKLTDDLSARVRKLTKGGNKYLVLIKSIAKNSVKIFIKELSRGKELQNTQSFPREASESLDEFSS